MAALGSAVHAETRNLFHVATPLGDTSCCVRTCSGDSNDVAINTYERCAYPKIARIDELEDPEEPEMPDDPDDQASSSSAHSETREINRLDKVAPSISFEQCKLDPRFKGQGDCFTIQDVYYVW